MGENLKCPACGQDQFRMRVVSATSVVGTVSLNGKNLDIQTTESLDDEKELTLDWVCLECEAHGTSKDLIAQASKS